MNVERTPLGRRQIGVRFTVLAVLVVVGLTSCWFTAGEPPTVDDLQIRIVPSPVMDEVQSSEVNTYDSLAAIDWTDFLFGIAEEANTFVQVALEDWTVDSEGTFTATVGPYEIEVTWSASDTEWVWSFEFPYGESVLAVEVVAISVEGGWDLLITADSETVADGFIAEDNGEVAVTYGGITYTASWGPATDAPMAYDHRFEAYQLNGSGDEVAGFVVEYTDDGSAGTWSFFDLGNQIDQNGFWPEIPQ